MKKLNRIDIEELLRLGIEVGLFARLDGKEKPINEGYVLSDGEEAYAHARVSRSVEVYGRKYKTQPILPLTPEYMVGNTAVYRSRVLVFVTDAETLIVNVGKDPVTSRVWSSLNPFDFDLISGQASQVLASHAHNSEPVNTESVISQRVETRTAKTKAMNDIGIKIRAAREYRMRIEASTSGVLLCRKEEVRQSFGGEYLKVNVSRGHEEILASESIMAFPPLHQAKDLVLLVLKDAGCFKSNPELFEGEDPYEIAQGVIEQGFKRTAA